MKKVIYILIVYCILSITACGKNAFINNKKIDIGNVQSSISEYYDELTSKYLQGKITVTNKALIGRDGELTRYTDESGNILRYTLLLYGETGKTTCDYYFITGYIYVNVLNENYICPIYERTPYTLYRTLKEGVIYKNTIYRFENGKAIESNLKDIGLLYKVEELSDLINE